MHSNNDSFRDFAEVLRARAELDAGLPAFTFLDRAGETSSVWTYAELLAAAAGVARSLRLRVDAGERVLLLLPPGPEFLAGLLGCWCASVVPVPALPPEGAGAKRAVPRLSAIMSDASCRLGLTTLPTLQLLREGGAASARGAEWLVSEEFRPAALEDYGSCREHPALLQYTSGSTGTPKGVVLSHANLLANAEHIRRAFGHGRRSQGVIWLPPQHDMGLVGGILQPLFVGFPVALMSPMTFLQRPLRWLQAISRFRATTSGGPDFAYRMCVERIHEADRAELDLSSWQVAFTGSELVRATTLDAFSAAFQGCGFRSKAFFPCYGLAEATLMVSGPRVLHGAETLLVDRSELARGTLAITEAESADTVRLVSCGEALDEQELVIVRPASNEPLAPGSIGEVLCRGPNVAAGYWQRSQATREVFGAQVAGHGGGFLRTGDLGCLHQGKLYIAGRLKELIIARGRNHYPGDLEATLDDALMAQDVAVGALCVFAEELPREHVTVCIELRGPRERCALDAPRVAELCRRALTEHHGLCPERIVFLRPGAIPKTTSGKLRRGAIRDALTAGEADVVALDQQQVGATVTANVPSGFDAPRAARDVERWLVDYAARKRGLPPEQVDVDAPFSNLGLDSLEAVTVSALLSEWVGRTVPASAFWDHPSIRQLARHVFHDAEGHEAAPSLAPLEPPRGGAVAIVGMACRLPQARSLAEYWQLLEQGRVVTGHVSPDRPGAAALDALGLDAGYVTDVEYFDAAHFQISADEARSMDPQQRLLLEVTWESLESAGIDPVAFRGAPAGVFIGLSNVDYAGLARQTATNVFAGSGNSSAIAANRLSYTFDLRGPSLAVDTACSSSLVAVHLACRAILAGECDVALAGGVNLILTPDLSQVFLAAGMLSPRSRCRPFEAAADGYVRGEACGVVVLKPLERALADGDRVFAVIRGSAVNQDGKSNGLTAPNGRAQRRCIERALREAGVDGAALGYLEAHGTGTPLGDPIEFDTLADVTRRSGQALPCYVGAVKANVGHSESAAGVVGLIKAALVLGNQAAPPQPEYLERSPRLGHAPHLCVPTGRAPTPLRIRYAGVSSFGFGGTNAHVVLEQAPALPALPPEVVARTGPYCVRVSARTEPSLRRLAERYHRALERGTVDAAALMRVSLLRRSRQATVALVVGADAADLSQGLAALAEGRSAPHVRRAAPDERLWVCAPLRDPEAVIDAWATALPQLRDAFRAHLQGLAEPAQTRQVLEYAAHRALCDTLAELGLEPHTMTGSGVGEVAAVAWACALDAAEGAELLRFVLGRTARVPTAAHVSGARRLLTSHGRRLDRVEASELRERYIEARPVTTDTGLIWGEAAAAPAAFLPLQAAQVATLTLVDCLAWAELRDGRVDWRAYLERAGDAAGRMPPQDVPSYAFERTRYWLDEPCTSQRASVSLELCWQRADPTQAEVASSSWLVIGAGSRALAASLQSAGVNAEHVESAAALQTRLTTKGERGVLYCASGATGPMARQLREALDVFNVVEGAPHGAPGGLRFVTRGAYAADGREPVRAEQTAFWGLVRSLGLEHPGTPVSVIDLPATNDQPDAAALAVELKCAPLEPVLLRGSERFGARLRVVADGDLPSERCPGATILITGGLGALGLALAQRFAALGAARLVLAGRDVTREADAIQALKSRGTTVLLERCDLTQAQEPARLLASLAARGVHLTGVVHAAGELADGVLATQTEASLERALAAKALGAARLLDALSATPVRFVGLVSSLAGTTGAPGQGSYGAANAYLDGLAAARRQSGLPVCSVALGPVAAGMGSRGVRAASALGLASLPLETAAHALAQRLLRQAGPWQLLTGPLDETRERVWAPPALRLLTTQWLNLIPPSTANDGSAELRARGPGQVRLVQRWLQERVAEALHCRADEVALDRGLLELGLDSLLMLQLRARLEQAFVTRLEPSALFAHPTIEQLALYLTEPTPGATAKLKTPVATPRAADGGTTEAFLRALEGMEEDQALRITQEAAR